MQIPIFRLIPTVLGRQKSRRTRLRIWRCEAWRFESSHPHHMKYRGFRASLFFCPEYYKQSDLPPKCKNAHAGRTKRMDPKNGVHPRVFVFLTVYLTGCSSKKMKPGVFYLIIQINLQYKNTPSYFESRLYST